MFESLLLSEKWRLEHYKQKVRKEHLKEKQISSMDLLFYSWAAAIVARVLFEKYVDDDDEETAKSISALGFLIAFVFVIVMKLHRENELEEFDFWKENFMIGYYRLQRNPKSKRLYWKESRRLQEELDSQAIHKGHEFRAILWMIKDDSERFEEHDICVHPNTLSWESLYTKLIKSELNT